MPTFSPPRLTAWALLCLAPLVAAPARAETSRTREVFFDRLPSDTVAIGRGTLQGGSGAPAGIQPFNEPAISGGFSQLVKMRNEAGEVVGFGVQQEVWTPDENGQPRAEFPTSWTLVLPGRGTLFLYHIENPTRLFDRVREARALPQQPWNGLIDERTSIGPGPGGVGIIVGGTGEFEGQRGTFIETNQFTFVDGRTPPGAGATGALRGALGSTTLTITYSR